MYYLNIAFWIALLLLVGCWRWLPVLPSPVLEVWLELLVVGLVFAVVPVVLELERIVVIPVDMVCLIGKSVAICV